MTTYTISTTVPLGYSETVEAVKSALADQGFGVLTEIDMAATLKAKLDVDIAPQVILGACRPPLAHQAITVEPSIAAVLPCNVVVRSLPDGSTQVEAFDPQAMLGIAGNPELDEVGADARTRIATALESLSA